MSDIVKAGLAVIRNGRILLCRKSRDTDLLITPGGKLDPGESDIDCLHREVAEELGWDVTATDVQYIGTYRDSAAGDLARIVEIRLYGADLHGEIVPLAEIAEVVWFSPESDDWAELSPVLRNSIVPDLLKRGYFLNKI